MSGMFDETLRELRRLRGGVKVGVPISSDEKGYIDKECPNPECLYSFKVMAADWKGLFRPEAVFCPRCRHEAPSSSWFTTEQIGHVQNAGVRHVESRLGAALRSDARSFNARQPCGGLIRMSMSCPGLTPTPFLLPAAAREALEQEIQCEACHAHFAVLGCAFFCPCCGHNSVDRTFDDALHRIVTNLDALDVVRTAMNALGRRDEAENACNSLVESSLADCVGAFQVVCDGLYARLPGVAQPPRNVFQRLSDGAELWRKELGVSYADFLSPDEFGRLSIYFQRRHLLAHTAGLVDAEYLRKSGDMTYRHGQRIVVSPEDVRDATHIVGKLVTGLRARMPASKSDSST